MSSVQDIIDALLKVPEDKRGLPCVATYGGDGVSYEISTSGTISSVPSTGENGTLEDMIPGEKFVRFYLD